MTPALAQAALDPAIASRILAWRMLLAYEESEMFALLREGDPTAAAIFHGYGGA